MIYYIFDEDDFSEKFKLAKKFRILKKNGLLYIEYSLILSVTSNSLLIKKAKKIFLLVFKNLKFNENEELEKFEGDFESLKSQYHHELFRIYSNGTLMIVIPITNTSSIYITLCKVPSTIKEILGLLNKENHYDLLFLWK